MESILYGYSEDAYLDDEEDPDGRRATLWAIAE